MLNDQIMLQSIFKHFRKVLKVLSSTSTQVLAPSQCIGTPVKLLILVSSFITLQAKSFTVKTAVCCSHILCEISCKLQLIFHTSCVPSTQNCVMSTFHFLQCCVGFLTYCIYFSRLLLIVYWYSC